MTGFLPGPGNWSCILLSSEKFIKSMGEKKTRLPQILIPLSVSFPPIPKRNKPKSCIQMTHHIVLQLWTRSTAQASIQPSVPGLRVLLHRSPPHASWWLLELGMEPRSVQFPELSSESSYGVWILGTTFQLCEEVIWPFQARFLTCKMRLVTAVSQKIQWDHIKRNTWSQWHPTWEMYLPFPRADHLGKIRLMGKLQKEKSNTTPKHRISERLNSQWRFRGRETWPTTENFADIGNPMVQWTHTEYWILVQCMV